ncbi:kinesin-like protein KIF21A isoform X1 [Scylla paramamosain]|uniref:kinesin-like protein KIF21A isoform X1 n=2 Tax=Scylla paramamosain TaxID=85552 RepID=UPI003083C5EE
MVVVVWQGHEIGDHLADFGTSQLLWDVFPKPFQLYCSSDKRNMFATPRVPVARSTNVKVFVRTRPLLPSEDDHASNVIHASSADRQVILEDGSEKCFQYDGVLEEDAGQEEVYMQAVAPVVAKVKEGYNGTVLAYGQTGSGKTYTMGTSPYVSKANEGILQRVLQEFLSVDENQPPADDCSSPHILRMSMVEIYSETVFDLLALKTELKIKNEIGGGASIVGLVEEPIDTLEKGLALLKKGSNLRSIGTTAMNSGSSRSHALVFLTTKHRNREGCLKLVDLAGAEGVGRAQSSGMQFTEGVNINKGLLCLGKVLAALSSSSGYVPYRESLLTRVLKDSLGGGTHTTMIACVNPSSNNVHETINTLRYAEQARNIKIKVYALSTIKKKEGKRRLEDVSANSGAWKKRAMSTEKADHNSTISTPGHKPPVRKLAPLLNRTVATPSGRISELHEQKPTLEIGRSLFPPPSLPPPPAPPSYRSTLPSLGKNIYEDDSPSGLSVISAFDENKRSPSVDSPLMERITSRLETTLMAQLGNFEERVADSIVTKLTQKKGRQRKAKKILGKSMCSTPTDEDSSPGTDAETSSDNILEKTIAHAFLKKNKMKNVLEEAVSSVLGRFAVIPSESSNKTVGGEAEVKPLLKLTTNPFEKTCYINESLNETQVQRTYLHETQVHSTHLQTPSVPTCQEYKAEGLPITSTAVCETRRARRSTRLATRMSLHKALLNKLSPETKSHAEATTCMNESGCHSFMGDVTVLQANATVIRANNDSDCDSFFTSKKCETTQIFLEQNLSTVNRCEQNLTPEKTYRRRSSRVEALGATQNSVPEKTYRRRSSRVEAIKATQRNQQILEDNSPFSSGTKRRRSCNTKNVSLNRSSSKKANVSMNTSLASENHTMMVSPRLQEEHNDFILNILNTGSLRELQQLPTVGPKTAMVISNFRKLYGKLNSVDELERVPGLSKNFYTRFTKANLVTGVGQQL